MPQDDTIFLKTKVDILSFFNEAQLRRITPDIEHCIYAKGQMILLKGEVTTGFFIVKKGKVAVIQKSKTGSLVTQELSTGDFFGEISMLEGMTATASIKAVEEDTEVLIIPHASFQTLLEMQPLLKQALLEKASSRKTKT
ncbi:MAG: cyclic nucleotide-binding domain-containing protein [Elusimicrobia bacterium]|nr:cyclic nucleotide-binding domain-containing protein [Elusimicrobiota bacterium]